MELLGGLGIVEDGLDDGAALGARSPEDDENFLRCHVAVN